MLVVTNGTGEQRVNYTYYLCYWLKYFNQLISKNGLKLIKYSQKRLQKLQISTRESTRRAQVPPPR